MRLSCLAVLAVCLAAAALAAEDAVTPAEDDVAPPLLGGLSAFVSVEEEAGTSPVDAFANTVAKILAQAKNEKDADQALKRLYDRLSLAVGKHDGAKGPSKEAVQDQLKGAEAELKACRTKAAQEKKKSLWQKAPPLPA